MPRYRNRRGHHRDDGAHTDMLARSATPPRPVSGWQHLTGSSGGRSAREDRGRYGRSHPTPLTNAHDPRYEANLASPEGADTPPGRAPNPSATRERLARCVDVSGRYRKP